MMPSFSSKNSSYKKSNYRIYRDNNLTSKFLKHIPNNQPVEEKNKFEKVTEMGQGNNFKNTEFIIPNHLNRKISEEKGNKFIQFLQGF